MRTTWPDLEKGALAVREINLSNGMIAFVSECDFERVSAFKWTATPSNQYRGYRHNPKWYACRYEELPKCPNTGKRRRKKVYLHRFLLECPEGMIVDHIDGNSLNYSRENLRIASYSENAQNRKEEEVVWA